MSLPTPPTRSDPSSFASRADDWVTALTAFSGQVDTLETNLNAAVSTVTSGLAAPLWASGTSYVVGDLVFSPTDALLYRRKVLGAGVTDPSLDTTNWALQTTTAPTLIVVAGTTQTGVKNVHYAFDNAAACTFTLPATPTAGDWVWVTFANSRVDNVVARNGSNIMGLAENLTANWPYTSLVLRFINSGFGWAVIK